MALTVIETAPKITRIEKEYKVIKGYDLTIEIEYDGLPRPTVELLRGSKPVLGDKNHVIEVDATFRFTIKKSTDEDFGDYTIRVKNPCGDASAEFRIVVMGKKHVSH